MTTPPPTPDIYDSVNALTAAHEVVAVDHVHAHPSRSGRIGRAEDHGLRRDEIDDDVSCVVVDGRADQTCREGQLKAVPAGDGDWKLHAERGVAPPEP